ncbi:hypothetical protein MTO96_018064 [Rhipicephalus appendiculatus]
MTLPFPKELSLSDIMRHLGAVEPRLWCLIEGEEVRNARHIICCGVKTCSDTSVTVQGLCVHTSHVQHKPHELEFVYGIDGTIKVCLNMADVNILCTHARHAWAFLLRLRTDCARTADRLFRLSGKGSPLCAQCPAEETLEHILLQCPGYDDQRRQLFGVYGRLGLPHDSTPCHPIICVLFSGGCAWGSATEYSSLAMNYFIAILARMGWTPH